MKKLVLVIVTVLISAIVVAQSHVAQIRITDANTTFPMNLPVGTEVYNIANGKWYTANTGVHKDSTLTTAAAYFDLAFTNAENVSINDAGGIINATDVEGALQEIKTAVDLNTAKETNVSTQLSTGTVTGTTYGITSDGGVDDVVIQSSTTTNAGLMSAVDKVKLDGIEAGGEVNLITVTEAFEESSSTPTAHSLANTANTDNGAIVTINGATLNPANYTFTATTLTLTVSVYQYDEVLITYQY